VRAFATLLCGLGALLLATPASGQLAWEPIGPVAGSTGMTAVASDPADPRVLWVAGATSIWVSDDSGETFSLVLQLARVTGTVRELGAGEVEVSEDERVLPGDADPDAPELLGPDGEPLDPSIEIDPTTGLPSPEDLEDLDRYDTFDDLDDFDLDGFDTEEAIDLDALDLTEDLDAADAAADAVDAADAADMVGLTDASDARVRFGITRIRVLGDKVYVCTGRGLWVLDRRARSTGTGYELRTGRRLAVNDVALDERGQLYIASDRGLVLVGEEGVARSVVGFEDEIPVSSLARVGDRLFAAAGGELREQVDHTFQRLGVTGIRGEISDLVALSPTRLLVVAHDQVAVVSFDPGELPLVEDAWSVPGASRAATGRDGDVWVVGGGGVWQRTAEGSWEPRNEGLLDRRMTDVAASAAGVAFLYVTGRAGAARLVTEEARLWTQRARFQAARALEGFPTVEETIRHAQAARAVQLDDVKTLETRRILSWFLPRVWVLYRYQQLRDERHLFIPAVDRRILDSVRVWPGDSVLQMEARWDLMPALMLAFGATDPTLHTMRQRARQDMRRVRSTVAPLYQTWATRRINLIASEYTDVRALVRDMLAIEQMEADLHVYTDGRFPMVGAREPDDSLIR